MPHLFLPHFSLEERKQSSSLVSRQRLPENVAFIREKFWILLQQPLVLLVCSSCCNYSGRFLRTLIIIFSEITFNLTQQIFIVNKSIERFTAYITLSWPKNDTPYETLRLYVIFTALGVILLPFFVVCMCIKVGNKANDGDKINSPKSSSKSSTVLRWFYRHFLPLGAFIHALSALCLLLPRVLMEAELIKHGFLPKADMIKTDLDFLFDHIQDGRLEILSFLQPSNASEIKWFQEMDLEGNPNTNIFVPQFVDKLGIRPGFLSLETTNFALALLVICIRYPSVFWSTNKVFGAIFSIQLGISSLVTLITFASFSILYKIHVVRPQSYFLRSPNKFALSLNQTFVMSMGVILMLMTTGALLYFYGHRKYCEWKERQDRCKSTFTSTRSNWWTFFPHFLAFASLLVTAAASLPLMYDLVLIYCNSFDSAPLVGASSLVLFLLQYIIFWLFLTLKHSWSFASESTETNDLPYGMIFSRNPSQNPLGLSERTARTESGYAPSESESKYTIPGFLARSSIRNKTLSSPGLSDKVNEDVYWLRNLDSDEQPNKNSRRNSCYFKNTNQRTGPFDEPLEEAPRVPKRTRSKRRESIAKEEKTFVPSSDRCQMNGDYELLIENAPMSPYGTVAYDDIYGIRSLFSPTGFTNTIHEVSVESDSSSGVHSDESSLENSFSSGIKRSRSSENIHQEVKRIHQNRATSFRTSYPRRDLRIPIIKNIQSSGYQIESPRMTEVPPPMNDLKSCQIEDMYSSVRRPTQMTSFAEAQPQTEEFPHPPEDMLADTLLSSLPTFTTERFRSESEFALQIQKHFLHQH